MAAPVGTTQLAAVNRILYAIGQQGTLADIGGSLPAEGKAALDVLEEVHLEQLMRGWHFNVELVDLTADVDSKIEFTADMLRVVVSKRTYPTKDITTRMDPADDTMRLYDKEANSFEVGDLTATVVYSYDFEETPEAYRRYVVVKAARLLQDRLEKNVAGHSFSMRDEVEALKFLKQHEGMQREPSIFDGWSAYRVLNRNYPT